MALSVEQKAALRTYSSTLRRYYDSPDPREQRVIRFAGELRRHQAEQLHISPLILDRVQNAALTRGYTEASRRRFASF